MISLVSNWSVHSSQRLLIFNLIILMFTSGLKPCTFRFKSQSIIYSDNEKHWVQISGWTSVLGSKYIQLINPRKKKRNPRHGFHCLFYVNLWNNRCIKGILIGYTNINHDWSSCNRIVNNRIIQTITSWITFNHCIEILFYAHFRILSILYWYVTWNIDFNFLSNQYYSQ